MSAPEIPSTPIPKPKPQSIFSGKLPPVKHKSLVPSSLSSDILKNGAQDHQKDISVNSHAKPIYNLMDLTRSLPDSNRGAQLQNFSRSLLRKIFFFLSPLEWLLHLCPLNKYYLMLCSETDDWRQFVMDQWHGDFWYVRSWRFTYVNEFYRTGQWKLSEHQNPFRDSMSDMIQLVSRAVMHSGKFPKLQPDSVPRVDRISVEEFVERYSSISQPVIITGLMDKWKSSTEWQPERFLEKYGHLKFRSDQRFTETDTSVKIRLANYYQYLSECHEDEDPIYIFDPKFSTRTEEYHTMEEEYRVEDHFKEDLFSVLGENSRPRYKWLVAGCLNSGTSFHIDPYQTSAWNALACGYKRWAFYRRDSLPKHLRKGKPRRSRPKEQSIDDDNNSTQSSCSIDSFKPLYKCKTIEPLEWFSERYPKACINGEAPVEMIQGPGEIVFVPGGWWHCVLNVSPITIAVTQNMCNTENFKQVFYDIWGYDKRLGRKLRKKLLKAGREDLFRNLGIDFDAKQEKRKKRRIGDSEEDDSEDRESSSDSSSEESSSESED